MAFPTATRAGQADATRISGTAPPQLDVPPLAARAYLLKCHGSDLVSCTSCVRRLAPAAEVGQRWIEPTRIGACGYYANVDEVAWVYGHGAPPDEAPDTGRPGDGQK
ncbi:hypothetical protein QPK31_24890 [Massilia sp. YIM B02769]|uniref:hypothetical protein n=1 Tax=Massilia sp. YIM B02769 TaxID=3050129 RepID=UPI0025B6D3EB|nr:hypothetical protein [Massilia sp. YIM B02769]MDN4061463.1 hypothetical protein [Massilia sp. YIM B02769]